MKIRSQTNEVCPGEEVHVKFTWLTNFYTTQMTATYNTEVAIIFIWKFVIIPFTSF